MILLGRRICIAVALCAGLNISLGAAEFTWFPQGDGTSFSDPGNWYNNSTAENPSGPPGGSDTATITSSANVTASGFSVNTLNGTGTATLTLDGGGSAQTVTGNGMTLKGSGTLTATTVSSPLTIVGGHMTATSYSARSLSVDASGSLQISGGVESSVPSQSFLFNVIGGATLNVQGAAIDVEGGIDTGAHATVASLANLNVGQSTLDVTGAGTMFTISAGGSFRNNSFDIGSGATVSVNSSLSFQGANNSGTSTSASSSWKGASTAVNVGDVLTVGTGLGSYTLFLDTGAQVACSGGIVLGDNAGSGTLFINDGASVQLGGATMVVGQSGLGMVTMDSSSSLTAGTISIGRSPSNNQFTASQDTILGALTEMVVGDGGLGTLHLQSGAQAVIKRLAVGRSSASNSLVIVEGATTKLSGSGRIDVGELNGRGTFEIRSSAIAQPRDGLSVGIYDNSVGSLSIHDGGEIDTGSDAIIGGGKASLAMASLQNGGRLTALDVLIFARLGGSSLVRLSGSLSDPIPTLLLASREIQIGFTDQIAGTTTLQVTNGGYADAGELVIVGNNGVLDMRGGSMKVGTTDFPPAGTIRIGTNGTLGGAGLVIGTVEQLDKGKVAPGASPGILTIQGNYKMNAGATLETEISGTTAGTNYDSLHITGTTTISGGILSVKFVNGFSPKNGQSYTLLQSTGGITGSFTNVQVTGLAPGFTYHLSKVAGSLSLVADSNGTATSAPQLQVARNSNSITLVWPSSGTWVLQSSTNLLSGWTTAAGSPTVQNGQFILSVPISQPRAFFRLSP